MYPYDRVKNAFGLDLLWLQYMHALGGLGRSAIQMDRNPNL